MAARGGLNMIGFFANRQLWIRASPGMSSTQACKPLQYSVNELARALFVVCARSLTILHINAQPFNSSNRPLGTALVSQHPDRCHGAYVPHGTRGTVHSQARAHIAISACDVFSPPTQLESVDWQPDLDKPQVLLVFLLLQPAREGTTRYQTNLPDWLHMTTYLIVLATLTV